MAARHNGRPSWGATGALVGGTQCRLARAASPTRAAFIKRVAERTVEFDINARDTLQRTALHWAAELGQVKAAELLIDFGVDVKVCLLLQ